MGEGTQSEKLKILLIKIYIEIKWFCGNIFVVNQRCYQIHCLCSIFNGESVSRWIVKYIAISLNVCFVEIHFSNGFSAHSIAFNSTDFHALRIILAICDTAFISCVDIDFFPVHNHAQTLPWFFYKFCDTLGKKFSYHSAKDAIECLDFALWYFFCQSLQMREISFTTRVRNYWK